MRLIDVPTVRSSEFSPPHFGGEPRVVLGIAQNWPALRRWDLTYLKACAGERKVKVRETAGPPRNIYQRLATGGRISFAQYLDWVVELAGSPDLEEIAGLHLSMTELMEAVSTIRFECSYYLDIKLAELSAALLEDVKAPPWYRSEPIATLFWCGVLGTSSGLHFDVTPNCNVQVLGTKHFILFPPSQSELVYRNQHGAHCCFDPNRPDLHRFPSARAALGWQCDLCPGDALYIPVGWFHQVTITSPWAANVNFFWRRPFPQGVVRPPLWGLLLRRGWAQLHVAVRSLLR
jgi:hypothetical protein